MKDSFEETSSRQFCVMASHLLSRVFFGLGQIVPLCSRVEQSNGSSAFIYWNFVYERNEG